MTSKFTLGRQASTTTHVGSVHLQSLCKQVVDLPVFDILCRHTELQIKKDSITQSNQTLAVHFWRYLVFTSMRTLEACNTLGCRKEAMDTSVLIRQFLLYMYWPGKTEKVFDICQAEKHFFPTNKEPGKSVTVIRRTSWLMGQFALKSKYTRHKWHLQMPQLN